jgi:histone H3/H4
MARVKSNPKKLAKAREERMNPKKKKTKKVEEKVEEPVADESGKKRRRDKDGRKVLRQIRAAQRSTENLVPRSAIRRLVREIGDDVSTKGAMRFTPNAISSIQVAAEDFLVSAFRDGQYLQSNIDQGSKTLRVPAFKAATQLAPGNTVALPTPRLVNPAVYPKEEKIEPMPTVVVAAGEDESE